MKNPKGAITQLEREFLEAMGQGLKSAQQKPTRGAISAGERQLMEEMLRQSPPLIRGMNSQTRIDMLKPPKFRK